MRYILCVIFYALYSMYCILCIIFFALYSLNCLFETRYWWTNRLTDIVRYRAAIAAKNEVVFHLKKIEVVFHRHQFSKMLMSFIFKKLISLPFSRNCCCLPFSKRKWGRLLGCLEMSTFLPLLMFCITIFT